MNNNSQAQTNEMTGFLAWIEKSGNKLPDPVFIFLWCIGAVMAISVIATLFGVSALHPTQVDASGNALVVHAESLLSAANIQRLLVEMPGTFTGFHPLGYVLVVMLGAGVAERSGLFAAAMSGAVSKAPKLLLTPAVALIGMLGNLAADAAYVVLIPLAGVIFAAAGRHHAALLYVATSLRPDNDNHMGGFWSASRARRDGRIQYAISLTIIVNSLRPGIGKGS